MGLAPKATQSAVQQSVKPSILRRFIEAVAQSNQRKAERVIAAYMARHAGALAGGFEQGNQRSSL
jgi:hypothetical protein